MENDAQFWDEAFQLVSKLVIENFISQNSSRFLFLLIIKKNLQFFQICARFFKHQSHLEEFLEKCFDLIQYQSSQLHSNLFEEISLEMAQQLSRTERSALETTSTAISLTYGEIDFQSFFQILTNVSRLQNSSCSDLIFYDLGSGTGRAVLASRLTQDFKICKGIEILKNLHNAGIEVERKFHDLVLSSSPLLPSLPSSLSLPPVSTCTSLVCGSILSGEGCVDWSDGDVVFANSTCFDESLMTSLSALAPRLKPGSFFVTFTKPLRCPEMRVVDVTRFKMSWGPATVYTHLRLPHPAPSPAPTPSPPSSPPSFNRPPPGTEKEATREGEREEGEELFPVWRQRIREINLKRREEGVNSGDIETELRSLSSLSLNPPTPPSPPISPPSPDLMSSLQPGQQTEFTFLLPSSLCRHLPKLPSPSPPSTSPSQPMSGMKCLVWCPSSLSPYLPPLSQSSSSSSPRIPVLLFLHGASCRGIDTTALRSTALPALLQSYSSSSSPPLPPPSPSHPHPSHCLVLSPLCPRGVEWKDASLSAALLSLLAHCLSHSVLGPLLDPYRVYLSGVSMGGLGSWMLGARANQRSPPSSSLRTTLSSSSPSPSPPLRFAAILPVCGGGGNVYCTLLASTPMYLLYRQWFAHCIQDRVVRAEDTDRLVRGLGEERAKRRKEGGGEGLDEGLRYTQYDTSLSPSSPGPHPSFPLALVDLLPFPPPSPSQGWGDHNCWDDFYRRAEVWDWLFRQRLPETS